MVYKQKTSFSKDDKYNYVLFSAIGGKIIQQVNDAKHRHPSQTRSQTKLIFHNVIQFIWLVGLERQASSLVRKWCCLRVSQAFTTSCLIRQWAYIVYSECRTCDSNVGWASSSSTNISAGSIMRKCVYFGKGSAYWICDTDHWLRVVFSAMMFVQLWPN